MNRLKKSFIIAMTAATLFSGSVFAARNIKIFVNGNEIKSDVAPFIKDSRTLVPIRFISESLKYKVSWDEKNRVVSIDKDGLDLKLKIDSKDVKINNVNKTTDVAPIIKDNRTFVPIRFISENFGLNVNWDDKTSTVTIDNSKYDLSSLTNEEKEYVKLITNYKEIIANIMNETKSYLFENANKYTNEQLIAKIKEANELMDQNLRSINSINVPERFKESHNLLLEYLAASKLILSNFNEGLIENNPDISKKIIALYTDASVKKNATEKALESEIKGEKYVPDKDVKTYNDTSNQNGNTNNLLEDPTIKNLLTQLK